MQDDLNLKIRFIILKNFRIIRECTVQQKGRWCVGRAGSVNYAINRFVLQGATRNRGTATNQVISGINKYE